MSAPNKLNISYLLNDDAEDIRSHNDPLESEYPDDSSRRTRRPESAISAASMSSLSKHDFKYRGNPNPIFSSHERSAAISSPSTREYPDIGASSRDHFLNQKDVSETKSPKRRNLTRDYKCEMCSKSFFERGM